MHVDFALSQNNKSSTPSDVFIGLFNELKEKYKDYCQIYTDGSKIETKVASAVITGYGDLTYRLRNGCSIFTAETEAIYKALQFAKYSSKTHFVIFSDSLSVLQAIHGQESKNPLVNKVIQACQDIFQRKKYIELCWIPSHRLIPVNERADKAAKAALSKRQLPCFKFPSTDLFPQIHRFVSSCWQTRWDKDRADESINKAENKLHSIMPIISNDYTGCKKRREDVIISRLRLGHTRLTHSYLMENRPPPIFSLCSSIPL